MFTLQFQPYSDSDTFVIRLNNPLGVTITIAETAESPENTQPRVSLSTADARLLAAIVHTICEKIEESKKANK